MIWTVLVERQVCPAGVVVFLCIEPVSANSSLRFRETGFLGPEIKVQILAPQSQQPLCRDRARAARAAKSGPLASGREISLSGGLRGGDERTPTACQARSLIEPVSVTKTPRFEVYSSAILALKANQPHLPLQNVRFNRDPQECRESCPCGMRSPGSRAASGANRPICHSPRPSTPAGLDSTTFAATILDQVGGF